MNQEVRFPLARWVRGVGFVDAGNVFSDPGSVDLGRLVTSVGGGLRVDTPFVLLRLDYGRAWTNTGDVRRSEWTFGIGHTF
jgi:outer membrane protein insertion porin family